MSFLFSLFFIIVAKYFFARLGEKDLKAIQSAHDGVVPRLGGLAVLLTLVLFFFNLNSEFLTPFKLLELDFGSVVFLMISVFPIFFVGLIEDLGYSMDPFRRLLASIISGSFVIWFFEVWVQSVGLPLVDKFLSIGLIGIIFTLIAASGVVNAFNLIDGLNGLASFTGISTAIALSFIAFEVNQVEVLRFLFIFSACILGFMFLNFPSGKIFLGDAGAYTIGHFLVWTAIILVNHSSDVSPFAILLIFFWPVADTLLAIWRRLKRRKRADQPDRLHFHQIVMRFLEIRFLGRGKRNIANPMATVLLIPIILVPQLLGVIFWDSFIASVLGTICMGSLFFITYLIGISLAKK